MDDPGAAEAKPPTISETCRFVTRQRHLVHIFIAVGFSAVMLSGVLVWAVSFFVRTYQMELSRAGMIVGISVAVFGGTGSVLGGFLGDYTYRKWGMTRLPLLPALTTLLAAISIAVMALSPSLVVAIVAFMLFEVLSRGYTAPGYNFLVTGMEPRMRGLVVSVVQGVTNLVGYGLGPVLVGVVSDSAGSLRYGLLAVSAVAVWVSLHFYWAHAAAMRGAAFPGKTRAEANVS
jgi:MFS family permease